MCHGQMKYMRLVIASCIGANSTCKHAFSITPTTKKYLMDAATPAQASQAHSVGTAQLHLSPNDFADESVKPWQRSCH